MQQNKQRVWQAALVLLVSIGSSTAWAQTSYNRWEAKPAPTTTASKPASLRGARLVQTKARQDSIAHARQLLQDSLRVEAIATANVLKRGIGQRLRDGHVLPEDNGYYEYAYRAIQYPKEALRAGIQGSVKVKLTVNPTGKVTEVRLVESTIPPGAPGEALMVQQARTILRQLRFEPSASSTQEELKLVYRYE